MMLVLLLCALSAASLLYIYSRRRYGYWKAKGVPQCEGLFKKQWRVNLAMDHLTTRDQWIYDQYPDAKYVGFYQIGKPFLMIKDVDLIKRITVKDFDHFVDRQFPFDASFDPLWKRNLVILEGEKWREARTLLTPSFTANKMKSLHAFIVECAKDCVDFLSKRGDSNEYKWYDIVSRYTTDAIAIAAYGIKTDSLNDRQNQFYVEGQNAVVFDLRRILKTALYAIMPSVHRSLKLPFVPQSVLDFFLEITDEIVKTREENNIVRPDVIHLLMEARKSLNGRKNVSNQDIAAHAFLYFLGGFDTVSSCLTFLFYELVVNPDVQSKLRREIVETSKRCEGELTYEALTQMKYMDMVVTESLRKWTPMPQVNRKCTKPYVLEPAMPGGQPVTIEKGTSVIIPLLSLHRDPKLFPEPHKFDPERFSDENRGDIDQYAFMAFGSGPRNCIGNRFALMEIKVFVYHVLRTFEVEPCERTPIPSVINPKGFSLKPLGDLPLQLKKIRSDQQ